MPTYCEKINQIQIGGLQPCDDLTWNDPLVYTASSGVQLQTLQVNFCKAIFFQMQKPGLSEVIMCGPTTEFF